MRCGHEVYLGRENHFSESAVETQPSSLACLHKGIKAEQRDMQTL